MRVPRNSLFPSMPDRIHIFAVYLARCHVSCYEVQSRGQQGTRSYFSRKTGEKWPLFRSQSDVKCLSYLIPQKIPCNYHHMKSLLACHTRYFALLSSSRDTGP
jgi:hypothetical protein